MSSEDESNQLVGARHARVEELESANNTRNNAHQVCSVCHRPIAVTAAGLIIDSMGHFKLAVQDLVSHQLMLTSLNCHP